ncbi:type II secretion system major pseudopilin GspG [Desulfoluna butyratoxydans]|uniref:Type II secretion system core protein G n=1 Tax=Desulfoluna butyratoxydans TaxID=231438 RepID=A0A4U8YQ42_9BACT|nr:type II secretion system major pseudopilin GspG [Desulfoluna butyratoxydans]VFQ46356.1 general secretion pathway protein g [Desulfoluna butyratoxydans]
MRRQISGSSSEDGFTLIEMIVVIFILGLLATYVAPRVIGKSDDAKIVKAQADIRSFETALDMYKLDNGSYPTTDQGLQALVEKPASGNLSRWREGGYLTKRKISKDPWGNEYIYVSPGSNGDVDISSNGGDGLPGGEGTAKDINNWDID